MDPKAAIEIVNDTEMGEMERWDALNGLAQWLRKGGAVEFGSGNLDLSEDSDDPLGSDLAASVRVAIEYGDLSGLDF